MSTYVVKENVPIFFSMVNHDIDSANVLFKNYYYRTIKNKNIKIRCVDTIYYGGALTNIVPNEAYTVLKATNRLYGCTFIVELTYRVNENKKLSEKVTEFAFKILSEKEFNMYKKMEDAKKVEKETIVRPKKQT